MSNTIGIGINENVVVGAATKFVEEGSALNLVFKEKAQADLFTAMTSGEGMSDSEVSVRLFPVSLTDWEGTQKAAAVIGKELIAHRDMLCEILAMYMDTATVNAAISMQTILGSVGINAATKATLNTRLLDETFIKEVFGRISKAFIAAATPHFETKEFRLKLVRASAEKNFARIPMSKFKEPWIESMQIPVASSQLGFSQWEIDNGKNSRAAVKADSTPTANSAAAEAAFKVPGSEAAPAPQAAPQAMPQAAPVVPQAEPVQAAPVVAAQPVEAQAVAQPAAVVPATPVVEQPAATPAAQPAPFPGQQPVG